MKYCFDLDGTITMCAGFGVSDKKIPLWIIKTVLFFYKPKLNPLIIALMWEIKKNNDENVIVTRRDRKLRKITKKYLKDKNIPYTRIIFIGNKNNSKERKVSVVIKINPMAYFDNNPQIIKMVTEKGVKSILV